MKWIIETERLKLREFALQDAKKLWELNLDDDVIKYTGDPPFSSIESAKAFIEEYDQYRKYGYGRWAVILKSTQEFIGWCGLKKNEQDLVDLGYRFFKRNWGNGYATEASKACLNYGINELNINSIVGRSAKENVASIKVLKKIGMSYWKEDTCKGIEESVYYRVGE